MGVFDFNTAKEQSDYETVPAGTIAVVQMNIRAGDVGEGGILSRSKSGEAEGLDAVFTVVEGKFAKRKFFAFMEVSGTGEGRATAGQIKHSKWTKPPYTATGQLAKNNDPTRWAS